MSTKMSFARLYQPAATPSPATCRPEIKKRTKSVSFVMEEEEQVHKKSKTASHKQADQPVGEKKNKKRQNAQEPEFAVADSLPKLGKKNKKKRQEAQELKVSGTDSLPKLGKKNKKKRQEAQEPKVADADSLPKLGKKNKKKRQEALEPKVADADSLPKLGKKNKKIKGGESIAENLKSLSIGENASSVANLLDEMKVANKTKKRKNKKKKNSVRPDTVGAGAPPENKQETMQSAARILNTKDQDKAKVQQNGKSTTEPANSESEQAEVAEEVKEKVKWNKRKWNKDKKEISVEDLTTTVVVENLPLKLMLSYKKRLTDHFSKCGLIKKFGIVEVYPTEESRPVFTTMLQFCSEAAADQALEEDNMQIGGGRVRVRRPLAPTETTLVVRSYRECSQQSMSSIFVSCGKIRNIREIMKGGRTSISTAFVEFDGPEAVEKALKLAADAKIGGKKIFVAKFEDRTKGRKRKRRSSGSKEPATEDSDSDSSENSE